MCVVNNLNIYLNTEIKTKTKDNNDNEMYDNNNKRLLRFLGKKKMRKLLQRQKLHDNLIQLPYRAGVWLF